MAATTARSSGRSTAASLRTSAIRAVQLCCAVVMGRSLFLAVVAEATSGVQVGFSKDSCPQVEIIAYKSMVQSYKSDKTVAPGVLRLAFHGCSVRGCDASFFVEGSTTEHEELVNQGPQGFKAMDATKKVVEKA